MKVAYREDPAIGATVNLVYSWQRGDEIPDIEATAHKDYIRNRVWSIFQHIPSVERVLMVRGEYARSIPFLLMVNAAGQVCDMAGKEVVIKL